MAEGEHESGSCGGETAAAQTAPEFLERAIEAHAGGVLSEAQRKTDFGERAFFENAQHDGVAIALIELAQGFVEEWTQSLPVDCGGCFAWHMSFLHDVGLVFAGSSPPLGADDVDCGVARRAVKPATDYRALRQGGGLAGERDENALRDIAGEMRVTADLAQGHGIDEAEPALNQFAKGIVRASSGEAAQQFGIVGH
jgi:hypothetical protein